MRRYDLDWLRVLVFGLLIFYHVGMLFVPWGFHIKNNITYDWLVYPMLFLNQWRLPILFVISGMGTFFALQKRTSKQFVLERLKRLYIPLAFGMVFIVPPQVYIERIVKGQFSGHFFEFWPLEIFNGIYPEGNFSWHHLWFLPYLLLFSLVLIPVFNWLKHNPKNSIITQLSKSIISPIGLYIFIIPLYFIEAFIEPFFPVTLALVGDWFTITNYTFLFFFGFLLMTVKDAFWENVKKGRSFFLVIGVICFSLLMFIRINYEDSTIRQFTEALIKVTNLWSWILTLFGFAAKYLNRQSEVLSYCNEAVYPFYILHQTVMMIIAYLLIDLQYGFFPKAFLLVIGTFGISWIIYELLIRRWKYIRPLFGLK